MGCSHVTVEQEFDQAKSSWLGATYDEMVMRWGPPNRSATLSDGRQTHTWTSQEGPVRAGGPSVGVGVFGGSGGRVVTGFTLKREPVHEVDKRTSPRTSASRVMDSI